MKLSLLIAPISITLIESRVNSYNSDKPETEHISLSDVISFLESQWKQVLGRVEKEIWINVNAVKTSTVSYLDDIDNIINVSTKNSWRNNPELAIKERQKLWELIQIIQQEWEWLNDEGKIYQALRDNYIEDTETYDDKKEDFFKKKEQFKKHAPHMDFSNFIDQLFSICPYGVLNTLFQSNVIDGNSTWTERDKQLVIRNMAKIEDIYFIFDRINNPDYLLSKSRLEEENKSSSHISQVISKFLKDELNIDNLLEKEKYILCARKSIVTSIRSYLDIPDPDYGSIQWVFNKIKGEKPNRYIYTSMDTVDKNLFKILGNDHSKKEELKKIYMLLLKSVNNYREICTRDEIIEIDKDFKKYKESLIKAREHRKYIQEQKDREREQDPEKAKKYIIWATISILNEHDLNISKTVQEIQNKHSKKWNKILKFLEIHNIDIQKWLDEIILYKNEEHDSWRQLNRMQWQGVFWILFELKEQENSQVSTIEKTLNSKESLLALDIYKWFHANYIDDLPNDIYYECINDSLENYRKVVERNNDNKKYGVGNIDYGLSTKKQTGNRRYLYQNSQAAIAWWITPEWKKMSLLRESIWSELKKKKLNKTMILNWFDQIEESIKRELKRKNALMVHNAPKEIKNIPNLETIAIYDGDKSPGYWKSKWLIPEDVDIFDFSKVITEIERVQWLLAPEKYWILELWKFLSKLHSIRKIYEENLVWTRKEREENSEKSRKVTWLFSF